MPSPEEVLEALRPIQDPELHRSIVELEMVRRVEVQAGHVLVEIALTVAGCPLKDFFNEAIPAALAGLHGVSDVEVVLGSMSEDERRALGIRLGRTPDHAVIPLAAAAAGRVVAVGSGKGGVGKSTVTVNLAAAMAASGYRVGLLDADVWGFSIPRMIGLAGPLERAGDRIVPLERYGVKAVSMGFFVTEETAISWRGPMLHKAVTQFLTEVDWGDIDVLLIDMPPGTGDVMISLGELLPSSELLIVTTPQTAAQKVAERAARTTATSKLRVLGVVENMSEYCCPNCGDARPLFGMGGGDELAATLGVPLLGRIPLDPRIMNGGDFGDPFVLRHASTVAGRRFHELAERTAAWLGAFADKRVFVRIEPSPARSR